MVFLPVSLFARLLAGMQFGQQTEMIAAPPACSRVSMHTCIRVSMYAIRLPGNEAGLCRETRHEFAGNSDMFYREMRQGTTGRRGSIYREMRHIFRKNLLM